MELFNFTKKEPLGFDGSMNFYSYCEGDPVNFVDVSGLTPAYWLTQFIMKYKGFITGASTIFGVLFNDEIVDGCNIYNGFGNNDRQAICYMFNTCKIGIYILEEFMKGLYNATVFVSVGISTIFAPFIEIPYLIITIDKPNFNDWVIPGIDLPKYQYNSHITPRTKPYK